MRFLFFILLITVNTTLGQNVIVAKGKVVDANNNPIIGVSVINKTQITATSTNEDGNYSITSKIGDEIMLAHLSYETSYLIVKDEKEKIAQLNIKEKEIETVYVTNYKLTGYLEIDTKYISVNENYRFTVPGLNLGYEPGKSAPKAVENLLSSLKDPVDLVYNLFSRKEKDLKKVIEFKNDAAFRKSIQEQNDREMILAILQMDKPQLDKILEKCNYSKAFIDTASDLQVLDALASAYEEYKVVKTR
jgi:hypothetical protein